MKYYTYVSDTKIEMLYQQVQSSEQLKKEATFGFDIKLLKGQVKESRGIPENRFTKLESIIKQLKKSESIGGLEDKKPYILMKGLLTWGTFEDFDHERDSESPITYWGTVRQNAVVGFAGSKHNLLGQQANGYAHSHSLTPAIVNWIYKNLNEPFPELGVQRARKNGSRFHSHDLTEYDVANAIYLASTQISGQESNFELLAKVLHDSEWPEGFRHRHINRVVLGTPLYVAFDE